MKKIIVVFVAVLLVLALVGVAHGATSEKPKNLVCSNTADTPATGTYKRVTVPEGATCYLKGATVTGNVMSKDAYNVYILDTAVAHNIHVMGTVENTVIGNEGCKIDPTAGNNIKVQKSHNVLICQETVDNNIQVFQNDGRITLKANNAGNNIMVQNNYAYSAHDADGHHKDIDAIRFYNNKAGNHNTVKHNDGRNVLGGKGNVPAINS